MLELIKEIRHQTGAGMVDIKKALEEAGGKKEEAIKLLRKKGLEKAVKKEGREAKEGVLGQYLHSNQRVGAFVKLLCETDFVARNEEFQELAKDIAMHVAAMDPQSLSEEDVDQKLVEEQRELWESETKGKPADIAKKILVGKEKKFRAEKALLSQPFVKDPDQTVQELIKSKIAKVGENIQVDSFVRVEL